MVRRRIFTRYRQRQHRRHSQIALMLLAASVMTVWASIGSYRQSAPSALVLAPAPLRMACAAGCDLDH